MGEGTPIMRGTRYIVPSPKGGEGQGEGWRS